MKNGFTLIELLVVLAIVLIIATVSIPLYGNIQVQAQLNDSTTGIMQALRIARSRSIARVNNKQHGVYFNIDPLGPDSYILYQGTSYATRDSQYDRGVTLSEAMTITTTLVGDDVNFTRGNGLPNATGNITIVHDVTGTVIISVNSLGVVEEL